MTLQDSRTLPTYCQGRRNLIDSLLIHVKNLCLDAPIVALIWQAFLASVCGVPLLPSHRLVLALVTWLAYLGDRLLDGPLQGRSRNGSERHCFVWTHRFLLQWLWAIVAILGMSLALWRLPSRDLFPGMLSFLSLAAYFLAARSWPRFFRGILPRELLVGLFFSLACSIFVFTTLGRVPALGLLMSLAFALLCGLDCWGISCTDRERDLQLGEWNLVTSYAWAWSAFGKATLLFSIMTLVISFLLPMAPAHFFQAIALSSLLMFLLFGSTGNTSRTALRIDLTLMTPILFLVIA